MHDHAPLSQQCRPHRFLLGAMVMALVTAAVPAWGQWGQHINEDFKLLADDRNNAVFNDDLFGGAVAIDNGIIAIGAPQDDDNGANTGSAYLFDASTGAQLLKLLPSDGAPGMSFGGSIAMDSGIVAVRGESQTRVGSVYLFDAVTGLQLAKLLASDGAPFDAFGDPVAISGTIIAVGASSDQDNGAASGSAYLFDATTGLQIAKLLPSDGAPGDRFGFSVAVISTLGNGIVAVGSPNATDNGIRSGAVYLFDASTGLQIAKVLPDDAALNDKFGSSVAMALANGINNGLLAVGAPADDDNGFDQSGSVYLFDAVTGTQITKVTARDAGVGSGGFGDSVAINNENLVVGASFGGADDHFPGRPDNGTAYIFDVSTGQQIAMLFASDSMTASNDAAGFGRSIDIDNGVIAIGAGGANDDNGIRTGAVYLFGNTLPTNYHKFVATNGATDDHLGNAIAIDNGIVAVAATELTFTGGTSTSVYLFDAVSGLQIAQLLQSDGVFGDFFGNAVDIDIIDNAGNGIVAVGAKWDDDNGNRSGSAYLFDAATGAQLFKLLPNDGAADKKFGSSIAIDNGVVAVMALGGLYLFDASTGAQLAKLPLGGASIVGSSVAIDNGVVATGSGSTARLFDVTTGLQIAELIPSGGANLVLFGHSIAINNGIVAVGATFDDLGFDAGSVYLFEVSTGLQIARLIQNDAAFDDQFATTIGIANGVVAVGAYRDDDTIIDAGSVYLFDVTTGLQIDKLLPSDGTTNDWFGWAVAMDTDFIVVGSVQDDYNGRNSGSAYVFDAPAGTGPPNKLVPNDGAAGDRFGWSIAIDNGVVAVGAIWDDDNGAASGAAYLFDASTDAQLHKLLPIDGAVDDNFGKSIAFDRGIVAVGAPRNDDNGLDSGSAYLFDAITGVQLFKLLPIDGAAGDSFGTSIAIYNGIVAVGAIGDDDNGSSSGSMYLFNASTGTQIVKFLPSDGAAADAFGGSIAIANGIVAVGAIGDDDNGAASGSAYLFETATFTQLFKLLPSDGAAADQFGSSIAVRRGIVAVGALGDDDNGSFSGSAYLFDASTGLQTAKLLPSDGFANDQFGSSISIDYTVVAVGSRFDDDNGSGSGSAYLFKAPTGEQFDKLLPSDGAAGDRFGSSISIDRGVVAVGAPFGNGNGIASGSAYVFDVSCLADLTGDRAIDVLDFFAFIVAFATDDLIADISGDDAIDVLDFFEFIVEFAAGCP